MPENKNFQKFTTLKEVKELNGKKVYYFIASTEDVDRDYDIVVINGIDTSNFEKNPVILFAHNYREYPVGKAVDIRKEGNRLIIGVEFAETEEGEKVKYLVDNGYMKAVSIGFIAKEVFSKDGWYGEKFDVLKERYPEWYEANKEKLLVAERVIAKSELLELSIVPVPANQNALVVMRSKGIDNICTFGCDEKGKTILIKVPMEEDIIEGMSVVPYSAHPSNMVLDSEDSWDKNRAIKSLREWASSDGSGDKDKIDWVKYRKGFTWYDSSNIDNFGSYKLPHHEVQNGNFEVVWRGVASAMASVLGSRGGVNIPEEDRKGVYNHLAKHYEEFEKEPPEFKEALYTLKEAVESFDDDTLEEFIKLYSPNELIKEFKDIMGENMELKEKVESLEVEFKELKEKLAKYEEIVKQLQEQESSSDKEEKSDVSPSEKEVDNETSEKESKSEEGDVVKVKVDVEDVSKVISEIFEKIMKGG